MCIRDRGGAVFRTAALAGATPAATAVPPTASDLIRARRSIAISRPLVRLGARLLAAAVHLLGCHPSAAYERAADQPREPGCRGADPSLVRLDRRVAVGRRRVFDLDRRVERDAECDGLLRAADARVADADRPGAGDLAERLQRAVGVRHRTLAPHLVQAPPLAMALVAELLHEATRIEVRPPRAVLVDDAPVGEARPPLVVERRQRAERHELQRGAEEVVRVRRTTWDRHHRLAREDLRRTGRPGRVRVRRRNATERGARPDRDDRPRLLRDLVQPVSYT